MKKLVVLVLSAILFTFCFGTVAYAVEPRWSNTGSIVYGINVESPTGDHAYIGVTGKIGTSRIECEIDIYRQVGSSWVYVTGDTDAIDDGAINFEVPFTGISGQYYKAEFTVTVYRNGTSEVIELTDYKTCP